MTLLTDHKMRLHVSQSYIRWGVVVFRAFCSFLAVAFFTSPFSTLMQRFVFFLCRLELCLALAHSLECCWCGFSPVAAGLLGRINTNYSSQFNQFKIKPSKMSCQYCLECSSGESERSDRINAQLVWFGSKKSYETRKH